MDIKKYLLIKNKNICKIDLNIDNSDVFLECLVKKLKDGFNFFIVSFSSFNDSYAFVILKKARQILAEYDALFIVSGRVDFALALGADGIYLDNTHLDIKYFKHIFQTEFIVASSSEAGIMADIYID